MPRTISHDQFEDLLRPYANACYKTAYRLTGSQVDTEDLIQELFIKLYQQCEQWREMEDPTGWIMRVLYNLHIDLYRKKARTHGINEHTLSDDATALDKLAGSDASPLAAAENSQRQQRLLAALDQLDTDQRALVTLHLLEGYSLAEVAGLTDTPVGTLKSRLHRSKTLLKKIAKVATFFEKLTLHL